ncbi:hypothetical protein PGH07_07940 [Sulfurovum sp. zt1-1]|uniref:Uncharacterized protein n=1 Tax=Sulfurovum zhangzhouensis TaxID=3019067 RepID=A0ABT7QZ59_9BACT|nr:hypothetical protein [Sulfurovum zhangzhouensis]MDM5272108.1 hypothetical protein [Sulfurovum zhangzhouensis]
MQLTTQDFINRYGVSHGSIHNFRKDGRLPDDVITFGKGGSDGNLYDQEKCDELALQGKFTNKAKKRILDMKRREDELQNR